MSVRIVSIKGVDIRMVAGEWPLPADVRAAVPDYWAGALARNPHLWDGRILAVLSPRVDDDGILRGEAREDAFSAFLTWRDAGAPGPGITNVFGSALIVSSDGYLIFGVMGGETANAGKVYPPGGSLEPRDVGPDGTVDVSRSTVIELAEETGLDAREARKGTLLAVFDGPRLSVAQALHFAERHDVLVARIRGNLEQQEHRELADVVAAQTSAEARQAGDLMPYAAALLDAIDAGSIAL